MRIITKDRNKSKSFKLKDVVAMQVGKIESVKDARLMEPSQDGEEFALSCLETINKFFSAGNQTIEKRQLAEPSWKHFKCSCNREWHSLKSRNLFLRSYYHPDKGWLKLKVDNDSPRDAFDKLGLQGKDKIMIRVEKHNARLRQDSKFIGQKPRGYIERSKK